MDVNTAWSKPFKYLAGISLVILGIYILYLSRSVVPLLIVATLIAMIVRPVIVWLHQRAQLPHGLAVAVVYLGVLILFPLALALVVPAIIDAVVYIASIDYPGLIQNARDGLYSGLASFKSAQMPVESLDVYLDQIIDSFLDLLQSTGSTTTMETPSVDRILQSLYTALAGTFGAATELVGSVVSQIALLFFTFLASIYISLGAHTYRERFLRLAPVAYQSEISTLMDRIGRMWGAYFRGELTLMLVIGFMCWVGLAGLGIPGALYLGIIAGLLELIPNLGPIIATVPAVIVALLQGSNYLPVSNLMLAGLVILLYVVVQQLENNFIVPRVLGDAVGLPALVVMTGVVVGTSVAGILGALLVTPFIASGLEIINYVYRKILGEEPFPPEDVRGESDKGDVVGLRQQIMGWIERLKGFRSITSNNAKVTESQALNSDPQVEDHSHE